MQITGTDTKTVNSQSIQSAGGTVSEDPEIKSLREQISELQKQIQSLAEDDSLDPKSKSDKKQELQKQITALNNEIRQKQLQAQREKSAPKERSENKAESKKFKDGFDEDETNSLISASNSLKHSKTLGSIIKTSEGRARILDSQIKTDKSRGANTAAKEKELEKIQDHTKTAKENLAGEANESEGNEKEAAAIKDKSQENKGSVAVNVGKRNRQISAAKSLSQIQMVMSMVQRDVSDCKNGKQQGMCDDDEVAKAEALLKQAQKKLAEISAQSSEEQEENEKDMSFYTTLLL